MFLTQEVSGQCSCCLSGREALSTQCCRHRILFWFFETQSHPVAQTGFELKKQLLPQLPERWHCRLVSWLCDSCISCTTLLFYKPTRLKMRQEHSVLYYRELQSPEVAKGEREAILLYRRSWSEKKNSRNWNTRRVWCKAETSIKM